MYDHRCRRRHIGFNSPHLNRDLTYTSGGSTFKFASLALSANGQTAWNRATAPTAAEGKAVALPANSTVQPEDDLGIVTRTFELLPQNSSQQVIFFVRDLISFTAWFLIFYSLFQFFRVARLNDTIIPKVRRWLYVLAAALFVPTLLGIMMHFLVFGGLHPVEWVNGHYYQYHFPLEIIGGTNILLAIGTLILAQIFKYTAA